MEFSKKVICIPKKNILIEDYTHLSENERKKIKELTYDNETLILNQEILDIEGVMNYLLEKDYQIFFTNNFY